MTDKQKTTHEESSAPFKGMPFAAMMNKMMGQQGGGCNCAARSVMAQMTEVTLVMAMCGGAQAPGETEASAQAAAQEARGARNG